MQPAPASKILFEFEGELPPKKPAGTDYKSLSEGEIEIIARLAQGMSNRDIAEDLALVEGTVKNYVSNILSKLHAANRTQAVNVARSQKII
jgi:DNA-binding NarL/FixJ family response regulator